MNKLLLIATLGPMVAIAAEKSSTMDEVANHASAKDCWIVMEQKVYDVSSYIPKHPAPEAAVIKYCGKNADHGWKTKDNENAHSRSAAQLLRRYEIGSLAK
jgi:cytochrome b involved in lipid metabolism